MTTTVKNTFIYLLLLTLLFSCTPNRNEKTLRFGVSQCSGGAWRDKMNDEIRRELLFYPDIDIEFTNAEDDIKKQEQDIQYFIDQNVDLLIVSPADSTSLTSIIAKAYDNGIPVIVTDRCVEGEKFSAFIGGDNEAIGNEMADYVIHRIGKTGGSLIEIKGTEGSTPVTLRHKGLIEGLKGYDNINLIASLDGNWNRVYVEETLVPQLKLHPDVDVIVAQNDPMAHDAKEIADSILPGNNIIFVGADGLPFKGQGLEAIENGNLSATAVYPTGGDAIIQTAMKILKGEPYERNIILGTYLISTEKQAKMLNEMARAEKHEVETIKMLQGKVDYYWELYTLQRTFLWTLLVFVMMFVVLTGVLFYLLKQRTVLSNQLRMATQSKLSFFTGVSHDFRTPLTLISGPISSLANDETLNDRQKLLVQIAEKNTHVLLRLINQVLDFRKYESGKLELNLTDADVRAAEKEWFGAFAGLAKKRGINLVNNVGEGDFNTRCDILKLERVFFNVMGNAFKFTPENGKIEVSLTRTDCDIVLRIADTGSGIPEDMKSRVFEDFYQVKSASSSGSGIGLAVVKSFVELHGGTIMVTDNESGKGTVVTITLPQQTTSGHQESMLKNYSSQSIETSSMAQLNAEVLSTKHAEIELAAIEDNIVTLEDEKRPVMLIIDDNADIITFMKVQFEHKYQVFTAQDGASGLQKALQIVPDIIICDLMMPGMNGVECCKRLHSELATCHIPVIMLTACSIDEERIKSHEGGADAYITKPFSLDVLQAQVNVLINNRKRMAESLSKAIETGSNTNAMSEPIANPDASSDASSKVDESANRREMILSAMDAEFMNKLYAHIDKNLPNSNYGVEMLAEDLGLSRSQLFRKVKAMTNSSPLELIRNARLTKAHEMLTETNLDIAVIASKVGFSTPSYFSKCYKDHFGKLPNEMNS